MSDPDFTAGDRVVFHPADGEPRSGVVTGTAPVRGVIAVLLGSDPYAKCLPIKQLQKENGMAELAELQKEASRLKIDDWHELTEDELEAAVTEARGGEPMPKAKPKAKARTQKASAAKTATSNGANPYRENSQRWYYAEELLRGGHIKDIVKRVRKNVKIKPAKQNDNPDYVEGSLRGRAVVIARDLAQRGFIVEIEGRGAESVFSVTPPKK